MIDVLEKPTEEINPQEMEESADQTELQ